MIEIDYIFRNCIINGGKKKFNYLVTPDGMHDILYSLPFKYFKDEEL